jgi:hypothetical protein
MVSPDQEQVLRIATTDHDGVGASDRCRDVIRSDEEREMLGNGVDRCVRAVEASDIVGVVA